MPEHQSVRLVGGRSHGHHVPYFPDHAMLQVAGDTLAALAAGEQHADLGQRISASLAKWLRDNGITESSRKDPSRMGYDLLRFHQFATSLVLDAWTSNLTQGEYALAARRSNQKTELDPLVL